MGRLKGLAEGLASLLDAMGIVLPPWGFPLLALMLLALVFPLLRRNHRTGRARRRLQTALYSSAAERSRLETEALELVQGNPVGLVVVADEAIRRGRRQLARRALEQLEATGRRLHDTRRLERDLYGTPCATPEEEILAIEHLLEEGILGRAAERLEKARQRWPHNQALESMQRKRSLGESLR